MPGGGDFASFFRPGGRSFVLKSCPRVEILTEKIVARGGMITGQIDSRITILKIWLKMSIYVLRYILKQIENFNK